jgi:hypothetical protein
MFLYLLGRSVDTGGKARSSDLLTIKVVLVSHKGTLGRSEAGKPWQQVEQGRMKNLRVSQRAVSNSKDGGVPNGNLKSRGTWWSWAMARQLSWGRRQPKIGSQSLTNRRI